MSGGVPAIVNALWLTEVLTESGVANGAKVTDVEFIGWIGTGQTGRNGRFALTWDQQRDQPTTIVGKFPSADEAARATGFSTGSYLREWLFYERIARTVRICVPAAHHASFDHDQPDFVLIMEDVSGAAQGDQLQGLTADEIALGIGQLVDLHAPRFGDPTLDRLLEVEGEPSLSIDDTAAVFQAFYEGSVEGFLDRLGDRLDDDVISVVQDMTPHAGEWFRGTDSPRTVVHMDFRADNLLFGKTPDDEPLTVVDWQTVGAGWGAIDLAYLVGGSITHRDSRAGVERTLVDEYRQRMAASGVELDANQLWLEYRHGSMWGVMITVMATIAAERTARGDELFTAMAQRHAWQALDLDALSLFVSA